MKNLIKTLFISSLLTASCLGEQKAFFYSDPVKAEKEINEKLKNGWKFVTVSVSTSISHVKLLSPYKFDDKDQKSLIVFVLERAEKEDVEKSIQLKNDNQ